MIAFSRTDLERLFPPTTWQKAESLRDQSAVLEVNVERDGRSITGRVRGVQLAIAEESDAAGHQVDPAEAVRIALARQ